MRPPIVRRSSGAPSRGHVAPRTRATWRSPVWLPPRSVSSARSCRPRWRWRRRTSVGVERCGRAGRGRGPARQRISSASRLPTPATRLWSSSQALSGRPAGGQARRGARRPRRRARRCRAGPSAGSSSTPPSRRGIDHLAGRRRRRSAGRTAPRPGRSRPLEYSSRSIGPVPSTSSRPVIPKRRPSVGPSVSSSSSLPMRRVPVTVRAAQRRAGAPAPSCRP